ncbi:hypothetical protein PSPO01_01948 [Paraphaeosphaeria sporulosa]
MGRCNMAQNAGRAPSVPEAAGKVPQEAARWTCALLGRDGVLVWGVDSCVGLKPKPRVSSLSAALPLSASGFGSPLRISSVENGLGRTCIVLPGGAFFSIGGFLPLLPTSDPLPITSPRTALAEDARLPAISTPASTHRILALLPRPDYSLPSHPAPTPPDLTIGWLFQGTRHTTQRLSPSPPSTPTPAPLLQRTTSPAPSRGPSRVPTPRGSLVPCSFRTQTY